MLGFEVAQSTVSKYMWRRGNSPSQSFWETMLSIILITGKGETQTRVRVMKRLEQIGTRFKFFELHRIETSSHLSHPPTAKSPIGPKTNSTRVRPR